MGAPLDTGLRLAAAGLAWLLGIGLQMQQPALWPQGVNLALVGGALGVLGLWRVLIRQAPRCALAGLLLGLALLAFGSTAWRAGLRLADALPHALEGIDLQLTGVVARLPQVGPQCTRFVFVVEQARLDDKPVSVPSRLALGWYRDLDGGALLADAPPPLRAGQRWLLTARLRQPHGNSNPHGFDLELWLFEQGIRASGTVRTGEGALTRLMAEDAGHPIERARQSIRDAMLLRGGNAQAAGVLAALAVGDQAAIDGCEQ